MDWTMLWNLLKNALEHFKEDSQDAAHWKVSVDGAASGPVTRAVSGSEGAIFEFTHGGMNSKLEAKPSASNHADVLLDGNLDAGAHVTFSTRSQPLNGRPLILVFEFVDVTVAGGKHTFRFDCPK